MSPYGYKRRCASPFGYARTTPGSRHSQPNVRFIGFSSAIPPGADAQDGGADSPNLTPSRLCTETRRLGRFDAGGWIDSVGWFMNQRRLGSRSNASMRRTMS